MEPEPKAVSETSANPDSLPDNPEANSGDGYPQLPVRVEVTLEALVELTIPVGPQEAYELMVGKLSGEFAPWEELTVETRGAFKSRFAQMLTLPIFEQCCVELLYVPVPK